MECKNVYSTKYTTIFQYVLCQGRVNQDMLIQQWFESESSLNPFLSPSDVPVPERQREVAEETLNWLSTQCEEKKMVGLLCQQSLPPSHCAHTCSNYFYCSLFNFLPGPGVFKSYTTANIGLFLSSRKLYCCSFPWCSVSLSRPPFLSHSLPYLCLFLPVLNLSLCF